MISLPIGVPSESAGILLRPGRCVDDPQGPRSLSSVSKLVISACCLSCVERPLRLMGLEIADLDNLTGLASDVRLVARQPGAIDDHSAVDDYIEFRHLVSSR